MDRSFSSSLDVWKASSFRNITHFDEITTHDNNLKSSSFFGCIILYKFSTISNFTREKKKDLWIIIYIYLFFNSHFPPKLQCHINSSISTFVYTYLTFTPDDIRNPSEIFLICTFTQWNISWFQCKMIPYVSKFNGICKDSGLYHKHATDISLVIENKERQDFIEYDKNLSVWFQDLKNQVLSTNTWLRIVSFE